MSYVLADMFGMTILEKPLKWLAADVVAVYPNLKVGENEMVPPKFGVL